MRAISARSKDSEQAYTIAALLVAAATAVQIYHATHNKVAFVDPKWTLAVLGQAGCNIQRACDAQLIDLATETSAT